VSNGPPEKSPSFALTELPEALTRLRRVAVGSTNGPKISAVRSVLFAYLTSCEVQGFEVESDVDEQPIGFREIVRGAETRAQAAFRCLGANPDEPQEPALGFGIEDGLVELPEVELGFLNIGCAVVTDGDRVAHGFSSAFAYPTECWQEAVSKREPIGEIFDRFWNGQCSAEVSRDPAARSIGNIGKLSLGVFPRAEYARDAVMCAFVQFLHPAFYTGSEVKSVGRKP